MKTIFPPFPLRLLFPTLATVLAVSSAIPVHAGSTFRIRHVFSQPEGGKVYGELILGSDGKVYGCGASGGANGQGSIFRMDRDGSNFEQLKSCVVSDGIFPYGGVIEGPDGRIYGCLSYGGDGNAGNGVVFAIQKDGSGYTKLKVFTNANEGKSPDCTPVFGGDGKLYGYCRQGGTNNLGTIFRLNPDGSGFAVIHHCTNATGASPSSLLPYGSNFLGTMFHGGDNSVGVFFSLSPSGSYNAVESFSSMKGSSPLGAPVLNAANEAVGTVMHGGMNGFGAIYRIGSTYQQLHAFTGSTEGAQPSGRLTLSSRDGFYYGTTRSGGTNFGGVFYRVRTDGTGFEVLRRFVTADGTEPQAGVLEVYPGVFLGTTWKGGGANDLGAVFLYNSVAEPAKVIPKGPLTRSTTRPRSKISGSAIDEIAVTEVSYKVAEKPGVRRRARSAGRSRPASNRGAIASSSGPRTMTARFRNRCGSS